MKKIGLALSGGGFRATLYHLGLVRFLRDAGILPQVTHITSVSGGSIMAAHLVLNWDRYTGSTKEFDQAATQLLTFIRMDVRNRIVRRFPLGLALRWPRLLLGSSSRKLARTWWLEYMYERYLYGDKSLFELPESPQLHLLTTNLSEGCLCSFNRDGLWMMQTKAGRAHIERLRVGLMTVPMAVTASSAFPGFFPPLELTGPDVGARGGEFGRQAYTDGGVFDNLGVRMFRWLEPLLTGEHKLDGVLVSDVGKRIVVQGAHGGGLIRAAMRSSDILMERVGQLENEIFQDAKGFVFARITDVVNPHDDPTAMHPEVQRQAANIRTDLDRFSLLEISCLIRHGYCLGRKACRSQPDLFGTELPSNPPWDPIPAGSIPPNAPSEARFDAPNPDAAPTTVHARLLQTSASRRIWSSMLSFQDWTSYLYVPLVCSVLFLVPYLLIQSYLQTQRVNRLVTSISRASPDLEIMSQLMAGPIRLFKGETPEELRKLEAPSYKGFSILQDSRILDFRTWNPAEEGKTDPTSRVYGYRRLKVLKNAESNGTDVFRVSTLPTDPEAQFRFPPQQFQPKLRRMYVENPNTQETACRYEVSVDLSKVPNGQIVELVYEHFSHAHFAERGEISTTVTLRSEFEAGEVTRWFLMPRGRTYRSFQILRYESGKPATSEAVRGITESLADDPTIIAYKMASVKAGYTYEITWFYK